MSAPPTFQALPSESLRANGWLGSQKGVKVPRKTTQDRNEYCCCIESNQNGKYCVRIHVHFARHEWVLPVYFLASTFDRAVRKLEQTLQFLQREEDHLVVLGRGAHRSDPNVSAEMLRESGLRLDRRAEFPRRTERLVVPPEERVPAFMLAPVRRGLAESVGSARELAAD